MTAREIREISSLRSAQHAPRLKTDTSERNVKDTVQRLCLVVGLMLCGPSKSEIMMPIRTIQISRSLATESCTARLSHGSNRKTAKIIAAAIVPSTPAVLPKRMATTRMIPRKISGRENLRELEWKIKIKTVAVATLNPAPIDAEVHRGILIYDSPNPE